MKLGRNVQDNYLGSLLWAFVREKSGSFNNHENVFLLILQFQIDFYGNLKTRDVKKGVFITVQVHDYKYF